MNRMTRLLDTTGWSRRPTQEPRTCPGDQHRVGASGTLEDLFHAGIAGDLSDGELLERFVRVPTAPAKRRSRPWSSGMARWSSGSAGRLDDPTPPRTPSRRHSWFWRGRPARSASASVSSWLFGVARRAAAGSGWRRRGGERYESRAAERTTGLDPGQARPADDLYPELHAEIDRLPEKYRLPIVLCYFEGLTHEQAASRLRWPVGTVKTRLLAAASGSGRGWSVAGGRSCSSAAGRSAPAGAPAGVPRASPRHDHPRRAGTRRAAARRRGFLNVLADDPGGHEIHADQQAEIGGGGVSACSSSASAPWSRPSKRPPKGRAGHPAAAVAEAGEAGSILRIPGGGDAGTNTSADPAPRSHHRLRPGNRDAPSACHSTAAVDKVLVDLGSVIKEDDPLLEVFSTDLAAAKGDYEVAVSQWAHDKKIWITRRRWPGRTPCPRRSSSRSRTTRRRAG